MTILAMLLRSTAANAEELDCGLVERLLGGTAVGTLRGAPLGFNIWRSEVTFEGFDRCRILDVPGGADMPTVVSVIECEAWTETPEAADRLAHSAIEALTFGCGRDSVLVMPTEGVAGIVAFDPAAGFGVQTATNQRLFDSSGWRSGLWPGLEETTLPEHLLLLNVLIQEAP